MRFEKSCGVVVFYKNENKPLFLLVQSQLYQHWGFAKGHVEENESEIETALREVYEETGLKPTIIEGFKKTINYQTLANTYKEVVYFLGEVSDLKVSVQKEEINGYKWLSYDEAINLLTYENDKNVLNSANDFIIKNC